MGFWGINFGIPESIRLGFNRSVDNKINHSLNFSSFPVIVFSSFCVAIFQAPVQDSIDRDSVDYICLGHDVSVHIFVRFLIVNEKYRSLLGVDLVHDFSYACLYVTLIFGSLLSVSDSILPDVREYLRHCCFMNLLAYIRYS